MQATVRIFASLKQLAGGASEVTVQVPSGATVADALAQLSWIGDDTPLVVAVNREYAERSVKLHPGDEIALIPPVSGGASDGDGAPDVYVAITPDPIDEQAHVDQVRDPRAGAVVTFAGVTREVAALEYEAYAEMAEAELQRIATDAAERHGLCRVAVTHRYGTVPLSEASVVIAVSAPHRAQAFDGAREIIDEIKLRAPIWKREEGQWVEGHLPGGAASAHRTP